MSQVILVKKDSDLEENEIALEIRKEVVFPVDIPNRAD